MRIFRMCVLLTLTTTVWAAARQWQTGTLTTMEQEKVKSGSTTFRNGDSESKHSDGKTKSSGNETDIKTDDVDTYEVYTIETENKVYIAREKLNFPWSKPAAVNVGDTLKFAVEGGKLYIVGEDQKEHRATVSKVSLNR